jgi:MFS family permease
MLIGVLLAVSSYLGAFLQILSGRIADRFDRKRLLIMGGLINFVFLAMTPMASSFWHLLGLLIIRSIGNSIARPAESALSIEEGKRFGMGSTIAALALATSLGMGIGPILNGIFHDYLGGIQPVFYFMAGVGLLGIILFSWYSRQYRSTKVTVPL